MFQTIKNLWQRDEQPESWKVAAASAMKMEMGVESLETRIMLAGSAVVDDVVDHVQPEFAPQIASEFAPEVAEANAESTDTAFEPETISLRKTDITPPAEAGDSIDGNDQTLVLNLNETSVLSVSQTASDATDSVENDAIEADIELAIEDASDEQLIQTDADDVVTTAIESTVRLSRSAPLTAPEQGVNHVADDLKIDVESDAGAYGFEFLEGHETRGPPAATGDSTTAASVLTLHAPLSSNASDNTTYDASSCPEMDGSHAVCSHGTLLLGENDTLGGHQTIGQSVLNNGLVSPGNSPGILNIDGDFTQSSDGTLLIEIFGLTPGIDGYDQINVTGDVNLDGLLQVMLDADFANSLAIDDEIVFLTYTGELTGDFANVSGLGIPGTLLYLKPELDDTDVDNKKYILKVESVVSTLTDEIRGGINTAAETLNELGTRLQSILAPLRESLPIVNKSIFDLMGSSAEQRISDFLDFTDAIETFQSTADSTLSDLQALVTSRINGLLSELSGTPVGTIAAYTVLIDERVELHVEFVIDWEQVVTLSNLDLTATIPVDTLSQLGLSIDGTNDIDVSFGFAARFGFVVDVTTPTSIGDSDIAVELSQLEMTVNVSEPITGISLDLNSIGSGIAITNGQLDLSAALAVTLSELDGVNRITIDQLSSLLDSGLAASVVSEWSGSVDLQLPLTVTLGGALSPFGQPIVRIQNDIAGEGSDFQSQTSVSIDLNITDLRTELLGLLDEIQALRPSLDDLPFPVPESFGLTGLFEEIGGLLNLRPDAENYFNAIAAFNLEDIDTDPAQLDEFRTLLGLDATFDDVTGDSDTNEDLTTLVNLLSDEYAVEFATGGLMIEDISAAVLEQFGTFATMGGLVAHLIDTRDLTASRSLFGITFDFAGGYDTTTRELFLNVKADFSGSQTFNDVNLVDLTDAIVIAIDGLKNDDTFRRISGTTEIGTFVYNGATELWQQVPTGVEFPTAPQAGDLFQRTAPVNEAGVYRHDGENWVLLTVPSGTSFQNTPANGDLFTLVAGDATGFTVDEDSIGIPEFDADGNEVGTNEQVDLVEFQYSSLLDVTVGISLDEIAAGTGTIGADIAFVRINEVDASVSLDMSGITVSLSIDGPAGSDSAVIIKDASFFFSGGVSMVSDPVTVTLADILGGVSLVTLVESLEFVTDGEVSAVIPLGFDSQIGAPIDTTEFGTPTILIDDANIFDDELPKIRVDFIIGSAVSTAILQLSAEWDALIGDLLGSESLNTTLPLIGKSLIELLGGIEGAGVVDALSIDSVLTTYLGTTDPTVSGLIEVLSDTLNARLGQLLAGLPFDISGGLTWGDVDEAIFTLDIGINIEQAFGLNVDLVDAAGATGPTADILNALDGLGVTLTGDFILAIEAALQGSIALTIDATDLVNAAGSLTNDDISIEFLDPLTADAAISVSDLNLGVDFSAAIAGLAPGIQNGTLDLTASATFGLTGTATENTITVAEITDGELADHLVITPTGSFAAELPIVGIVEAIPDVDGSLVVRIIKDDLFDLTTTPLTIIDAELTISEFIYLRGSIAGVVATQLPVTLVGGEVKELDLLTIGIGDADLFIGTGGPSHVDLDGNGMIDADEMNGEATGLVVNEANVAIAIFTPTDTLDTNRYIAVGATATTVSSIGLPLDFSLSLTDASVNFNFGTDNAVNFAATDFGDEVGNGLMVATGAAPFVLNMDAAILQAEANVTLNLGGFVLVTGTFAFSVEEGTVVTDDSGVAKAVDILTIGASNVDVQIGSFDQDGTTLVAGLELTGVSFGIAILSTTDPSDPGVYYSAKAEASSVTPIGLPTEISISATNVLLGINTGNDGFVDYTHDDTTYSGAVNVGGGTTVDLDFATELFEAAATLSISLGGFVFIDGTFAFRRGPAVAATLSDETEKQVSGFTIGGTGANIFIGTGGPFSTNPAARGFELTDVEFGLAIFTSLAGDGFVYYGLEATVGGAALQNLTDIDLATGQITIAVNGSTDTTGAVIDFANSGFDGSDEGTDPDGHLEVFTGGEQPVEIDLSTAVIRIEILAGTITITEGSNMHSMSGNFVFELSDDDMGQPQFVAGIANLVFNGTQEIEDGVGALVIKDTGVALLVFGRESASGGGLAVDAGLGLRVNTTGGSVNETITVGGQDITINSTGDEVVFFVVNATFTIGDFIYINGSLNIGEAVNLANGTATLASGIVDIFVGAGPYLLSNGEVNPDAVGILITDALVGILTDVDGNTGLALWAEGEVSFIGVPGVQAGGTVRVEVNTTGVVITDDLTITNGLGEPLGTAEFDFVTTDNINRVTGDVTVAVPDVFEINGEFTFTTYPNGMLEVDIANMELRIFPEDATNEAFSITAHATFTIDRIDGFKLRFIQVVNFSIYDVDAGNSTSGTPPPELAETLGFPDVSVGAGGNPIAAIMNPLQGATVDATTLSAQGFIDITFSVGTVGILDSGAEFTLTGSGVSADLLIDNDSVQHLYGTTYRYKIVDVDPTNNVDVFTTGEVTVNFIAGSFTNSITSAANLADSTNTFTVADNAAVSGATFNIGPLQVIGPKFQLSDFAYTDGTLFLTIGIGANQVNLGFGDGQSESGITASLTDVLFTFDVELGFDVLNPNFFSDPLAHVSGPGLTGAFSFSAQRLQVAIPDIFELDAYGVFVEYDPNATGTQNILTVAQAELVLIPFNVTGTVENLVIRNDGFAFDDLEIEWNAEPGMPLSMAGLFEVSSLGLGITNFDITFGEAFVFTGSVTIFTDQATFLPGKPVEATVSQRPGSEEHGLSATLNFGDDGSIESLMFHIDQIEIQIGSLLTITGSGIDIDSGAWGDENQQLVSFDSLGARVRLGAVIVGGEARNFAFMGDGSFVALGNFAVLLSVDAVDGDGIGWPSWMPIRITEIGLVWPDIENEPLDFILVVSAEVVGLHGLPLNFTGAIDRVQIDIDKLVNGEFPIIGVDGISVGVDGDLFGGEITAQLLGGILRLDADGNVIDSLDVSTPVADSILFAGLEGGFSMAGVGGFTIRLGLSELGPLGVFITGNIPGGILLEPQSGLSINEFSAGVDFFTSLPDYTDPFELEGASFGLPTDLTPLMWLDQIRDQVAAQWIALQADPTMPGLVDAFSETMVITGGAKLFSRFASEETFNGEVIIKFSTDGKFALTGKLNFAADNLSISARLFADFSNVAAGDVKILFLATAPDQAPIMTIYGELTLAFPTDGIVLNLAGGIIYEAPLGTIGDVTGANIEDVELFRIDGTVDLTLDTERSLFAIDVSGTMSMVYLGTIGSVSGRLVLQSTDSSDPLALPDLWGVLKLESGLDKLAEAGIELNAEALLMINTSDVERIETLRLLGIVGDALATVNGGTALTDLDALSPVIPPLPLDGLPASVKLLLESTLGVTLDENATVEVIVTGAQWKVRDDENDVTYFLEEVAGGQLRISSEFQRFTLAAETFQIQIRGDLIFRLPAFEADGITPGPDLFVISGGASLKINRDGLEAFVLGRAKVGPTGSELLEFDAQGVLIINDTGIAGGLSLQLDVDNVPGIDFTGGFTMILNTMPSGLQTVAIPTAFQDVLLPTPPTINGEMPGDLIEDDGDNRTLFWRVNDDGVSLTPVLVVPGEAPDLNGNFDPAAINTPFLVIAGNATLVVNPGGIELLRLEGRFQITIDSTRLNLVAAFSTSNIVLGTLTGTAALTVDADGLYGVAQVTQDIGSPLIPGVELNLGFLIEFNTSSITKTIQRFEVDRRTGVIATSPVEAQLEAEQVRIVAGGELIVRASDAANLVTITGRFEFVINSDELAISIAARLALGDGAVDADVEGAALIRADGFAIQILATAETESNASAAGAGFRLELGGAALIRVNTINEFIPVIAGVTVNLDAAVGNAPFFQVRFEGAGLIEFFIDGIGGLKIQGEIRTDISSNGVAITVNGELTANIGGTTLLRMNASGAFLVYTDGLVTSIQDIGPEDGIAGKINLQLGATALLGGVGFNLNGTFTLEVNTTNNAITNILGQTVNLAAGPYARIMLVGRISFSLGGAASFVLDGSGAGQGFAIEMNATRIAITADATLKANVAGKTLLSLDVNNGLLAIGTDGIVANLNLGGGLSGPGFSFSGSFRFRLNTTSENVFINNGVVLPGIKVEINGDLSVAGGFSLSGQFAIELNNNGLVIDANAELILGTIVRLELIDSFLQITDQGIAAQLSVGGRLGGGGFQFSASMTLRVNTTGQAVTRVNGRNVNLRAGYFAELEIIGDLSLLNILTLKGRFLATAGSTGLSIEMDATLSVMDIGFRVQANAQFSTAGVSIDASISLASGGNSITPISGLSIDGNFRLQVNTIGSTYVRVGVNGNLRVSRFTLASVNFNIEIRQDGFSASFAGRIDVAVFNIDVSGSFDSNGTFSVTGSAGFHVNAGPAYLTATASLTINNSGLTVAISGRAGINIAGINVGVSVNGVASISGSSLVLDASACLTINLLFFSFDICVGVTFSIGTVSGTAPGGANTTPPPSIGSLSGNNLNLDLNQLGGAGANNLISILDEGDGLIRVSGNGLSQVFGGVGNINLNLGAGDDYFYVGQGVAANVNINGGDGDDEIVYLGSGQATLNGGNGNDELRVINDRNFRAEPTETGQRAAIGASTFHTLIGGAGDDILIGGSGNDLIQGGDGNDRLDGGGGDDTISGGGGNDIIYGGEGNDMLMGDGGDDVIYGEQGNDTLDGGAGRDILLGGSGNETIFWTAGTGDDIEINGQSGDDQIVFIGTDADNTITASQGEMGAFVLEIDGQSVIVNEFESARMEGRAGTDSITVNDLSATTISVLELQLGDDSVIDNVTVNGLATDDEYTFFVEGSTAVIQPTGGTRINITQAGSAFGGANAMLFAGFGNDIVNIRQTVAGIALTVHLDEGDDEVVFGDATTGIAQVAGPVTIFGGLNNDQFAIDATSNTSGITATLNATTLETAVIPSGRVTFFDIETMNLDFGSGDDTLTINENLQTTVVDLADGNDTVLVKASQGDLDVLGGTGDDTIWVGSNGDLGNGTLANVTGQLTFNGQDGNDRLFVDNAGDISANTFTLTNNNLSLGTYGEIPYANFETLTLESGTLGDVITIASTHVGVTNVNTNEGDDTVHVQTVAGALNLTTGENDDTINIGSVVNGSGTLNSLLALVTIQSGTGTDTLNVDDSADAADNVGEITVNTITGFNMTNGIFYEQLEFVNFVLGSGNDTLTVTSTSTATYDIDAASGNDTIRIESIDGTTTITGNVGDDIFDVGTSDLLDPVAALLTIQAAAGNDTLNISDSADATNNTGQLTATTLRGFGMASGIDYFDVETLNFTLGTGNDTLTVVSTHVRNTNINANNGADAIWIQTSTGTTVVNGDAGEDLIVTQTNISGVLNVFGGTENDAFWISSNGPAANGVLPQISGQLTFDGQAGDDSLFADNAGDTNANDFTIESTLLTFDGFGNANYLNVETLTVNSGSAGDTITVATTHAGVTNVNSNAGADTIHVQTIAGATNISTSSENDTINVGSVVDGSGTLNGILALLTIQSGAGTDTLNVDDSAETSDNVGEITVTTITGFDMTEGIVYGELEFVNFVLGSGNDTLTVTSTSTATYDIDAASGNDTVRIESIDGTTTITGNVGDDDFVVGTSGLLDPVNELLTIHGAAGNNTLTVTDNADTTDNNGHLTATTIRGLGMADGIDYFDIAVLDITLGMANDEFTVFTSHVGQTTLNGNNGNDTIWVETLAGRTFVNGDAGDDLVTVGLLVDGDTLPTIDHLRQQLTVTGGTGSDTLTLDDRGNDLDLVIGIDQSQVTGLTDQPVEYFELAFLNILAGSGSEVLNVRGSTATEETNVLLADGDERIFVSSDANLTQANKNEIDFLTGHLDLLVGGNLNINAGDGRHKLFISDEAATAGDNNVVITDSNAEAIAAGLEIFMSGLAVSNISYGAAATGNFADGITIWSGHGNDTFNVDATHYRNATDGGGHQIRTITSLNTGLGDDTITVSLTEGSDGFFVLNTQGPYNDQPNVSDADTVDGSGSTLGLYIFGGQDQDNITGGQGRDIIFGDRGSVLFFETPPADTSDWTVATGLATIVLGNGGPGDRTDGRVHEPAFVRSVDVTIGDNDIISGQGGDDYIMGQAGDDQIDGGAGEDDIIGGHNVAFGPDGNDTISGGDDADVIIGDNGTITRNWLDATNEFERHPAPFADVIRTVVLYDNLDGIGGDDIINGDGGDDILFGQLGDDTLDGGNGDDELTGGLGNNTLIGGAENDLLVGGPAQILRAYNEDGTPLIDSNGSWHRDVVFELVGTVVGFVDINDTPIEYLMWSLAEELLRADIVLVVGVYDADGNRVYDEKRNEWKTRLLLIDLDAPGTDTINGMDGDDIIIGGFGDDTLNGGAGDDLIIGDYGTNLLPYGTDLPLMITAIRLRDDLTGTLDLEPLGTLIVPDFAVETVMTQTTTPFLQVVPPHATDLQDIAYNDLIAAADGTFLDTFASIVPDVRNHLDAQPGNDTIDGGNGDDTLIGDNLVIRSPIDTLSPAFDAVLNSITNRLVQIQTGLYHVSSLLDVINTELVGNTAGNTFTAASDTIIGGAGNDTIAGDNALWIGPAAYQLPIGDDIVGDGIALYRRLLDLDWAFSDTQHTVEWARQLAHRELRRARLTIPRAEISRNTLSLRNDSIIGGDGNDTISGDDTIVQMPIVTSFDDWRARSLEVRDNLDRQIMNELSREIAQMLRRHNTEFALHRRRDYRNLAAVGRVERDSGRVSYDLIKGNDTISGEAGDDMVAGDTLIIGKPAYDVLPQSRPENNRLRGPLRRILNRTRTRGFFHRGNTNYRTSLRIPLRRGPELSEASDQIFGGDGNDILVGDNAEMTPYVFRDNPFDPETYEVRSKPKLGNVYNDNHRGGNDTIEGGAGDDILDGRSGFDNLNGNEGADQIFGGGQRDTITTDDDDLFARQGGQMRRHNLRTFSNGWMDQVTDVIAASSDSIDPTPSGLWIRIRLRR